MELLNIVKLAWMTGVMLIAPGIIITAPLAILASNTGRDGNGRQRPAWQTHRALLLPFGPVILMWIWAATYARGNQHAPLVRWQSQGVFALAAFALAIAGALVIRYRREWRTVIAFLALASWIAIVACVAGLWAVQGWPSL